jgi:hypothetical protein
MMNYTPDVKKVVILGKEYEIESTIELRIENKGLTNEDIEPIRYLVHLKKINLNQNHITDLSVLEQLVLLEEIELDNNKTVDITPLANLKNLRKISLKSNKIIDIKPLSSLTNLSDVYLNNNKIADVSPLVHHQKIWVLDLDGNRITDLLPLSKMKKVGYLSLNRCGISDLTNISGCPVTERLCLNNNKISDVGPLSGLKVEELRLEGNAISDISGLSGIDSLEDLRLNDNPLQDLSPLRKLKKLSSLLVMNQCYLREDVNFFLNKETMAHKITVNGAQFTVMNKVLPENIPDVKTFQTRHYSSIDDIVNYYEGHENRLKFFRNDISKVVAKADDKNFKAAYQGFLKILNALDNADLLADIAANAPKEKNGALAARRVQHICALPFTDNFKWFYELVAENTEDNSIEILLRKQELIRDDSEGDSDDDPVLQEIDINEPARTGRLLAILRGEAFHPTSVANATPLSQFRHENGTLIEYIGNSKHIVIPDCFTKIGERAFYRAYNKDNVNPVSIVVPESVTEIGASAFYCGGISELKDITLPESLQIMGECMLAGNYNLVVHAKQGSAAARYAAIDGVKLDEIPNPNLALDEFEIADGVLVQYNARQRAEVTIPAGVVKIGEGAFASHDEITRVVIPEGVKKICRCAFTHCPNVTSIEFPIGLTDIESGAFVHLSKLQRIDLPANMSALGPGAFGGCDDLVSMNIPEGITSIDSRFISAGEKVKDITLPASATYINLNAFASVKKVEDVTFHVVRGSYAETWVQKKKYRYEAR